MGRGSTTHDHPRIGTLIVSCEANLGAITNFSSKYYAGYADLETWAGGGLPFALTFAGANAGFQQVRITLIP